MSKVHDITGQRFGKLVVVKRLKNDSYGHTNWLVKCDCGSRAKSVQGGALRTGQQSCGCILKSEFSLKKSEKKKIKNRINKKKKAVAEINQTFVLDGIEVTVKTTVKVNQDISGNDKIAELLMLLVKQHMGEG